MVEVGEGEHRRRDTKDKNALPACHGEGPHQKPTLFWDAGDTQVCVWRRELFRPQSEAPVIQITDNWHTEGMVWRVLEKLDTGSPYNLAMPLGLYTPVTVGLLTRSMAQVPGTEALKSLEFSVLKAMKAASVA